MLRWRRLEACTMDLIAPLIARMEAAVLDGPGHLPPALRRAAATLGALPAPYAGYVEQVATQAYRLTDADVGALLAAGTSEDEVFEISVSAAVGAGMRRYRAGMAALAACEEVLP